MPKAPRRWSTDEDAILRKEVESQLEDHEGVVKDWNRIAHRIPGRSNKDCRKRYYNEVTGGLKKGAWTEEEDALLTEYVAQYRASWAVISQKMKHRSADQCSKRWTHCLDPNIDRSEWTDEDNAFLLTAVKKHGTAWKDIQRMHLPGRSANTLKNQYNLIQRRGIQLPADAEPCCPPNGSESSNSTSGHSPLSLESATDSSGGLIDGSTDIDFGDLSTFDVNSPFAHGYEHNDLDHNVTDLDDFDTLLSRPGTSSKSAMTFSPAHHNNFSQSEGRDPLGHSLTSSSHQNHSRHQSFAQSHDPMDLTLPSAQHTTNMMQDFHPDPLELTSAVNFINGNSPPQPGTGRTMITLENIEPEMLSQVMSLLVRSRANVKFEMSQ